MVTWSAFRTTCDYCEACGAFGICNAKASPICSCLGGFKANEEDEWNQGNWSGGCVQKTPLKCQNSNNSKEEEEMVSLGWKWLKSLILLNGLIHLFQYRIAKETTGRIVNTERVFVVCFGITN